MKKNIFKTYRGAGIALFKTKNGASFVLLGKRKYKPYHNTWSFLGGGQEGVEKLEKTAYREFSEETGTNINDRLVLLKKVIDFKLPFFRWKTILIETTQEINLNQEFYKKEFFELKWVNLKDLKAYKLHPFVKTVIKKYIKGFSKQEKIDCFINKISKQIVSDNTTNIYFFEFNDSKIKRENLKKYLYKMIELNPKILLLGEAPGYKGCANTGIPFTSETVLCENDFFKNQDFKITNNFEKIESENSATIVWSILNKYKNKPLVWNVFPFHSHDKSEERSNRIPSKEELLLGEKYLIQLLNIFEIDKILAVGKKAESIVKNLNYNYVYIRHPSYGGKEEFISGIKNELK